MGKQWKIKCKRCGKWVGYSDYSYQSMRDFGHSRPEYCDACRESHKREKEAMGVSYFTLTPLRGMTVLDIEPGALGKISHPERKHIAEEKESQFDQAHFGITPENIKEIYDWFQNPKHRVVVVVGPTGSGKSTALPYWLMEPPEELGIPSDYFTRDGQILITQPRIPAAEGVAVYTGETLVGGSVGKGFDVGYRHSKDRNYDWRNRMFQATDGSLINWIQQGKLSNLSIIIIDEAHERSLNIDTILKLLKEQLPLYPHLKIIIASATIDAEMFLEYFGRDTATIVELEGKDIEYQTVFADENTKLPYENPSRLQDRIVSATATKVSWLLEQMVQKRRRDKDGNVLWGDVLVFLHGVEPIETTAERIRDEVEKHKLLEGLVDVYTLYADLPEKEKEFIKKKDDPDRIRVIVSTNVAETSLTVEGVVFVVDSGLEYQSQWNREKAVTEIVPVLISKANAKQRWGRSGRTQNGEVHCLYTKEQHENLMPDHPTPAIQRSSLEEVILTAKAAGAEDINCDWIQNPTEDEIQRATHLLQEKEALDKDGDVTEYGSILRYFAYATPLADLIMLADRWGCVVEVATVLPVIKNGGQRYFLEWDYNWDARKKREVWESHKVLMAGCHDDLEFILKVYKLWTEQEDNAEKWAGENYLRHTALEEIDEERQHLLENLYGRRRETTFREIDFTQLDKVRILFAYRLGLKNIELIREPGIDYEFDPTKRPQADTITTHRMLFLPEWAQERTFKQIRGGAFSPLALAKVIKRMEETTSSDPRVENIEARLFNNREVRAKQQAVKAGRKTAFDRFSSMYSIGDDIEVAVKGHTHYVADTEVSLILEEAKTGAEILLEPGNLGITYTAEMAEKIPTGARFTATVKSINRKKQYVELTCWKQLKEVLERKLNVKADNDKGCKAVGEVIDIWEDGRVFFLLDWSTPNQGLLLVASAKAGGLCKPAEEFELGEKYNLYLIPDSHQASVDIDELPERVKKAVRRSKQFQLSNSQLCFSGQMSFNNYLQYRNFENSSAWQNAMDTLFRSSNQLWINEMIDPDWVREMESNYPKGKLVKATIKEKHSFGMVVELDSGEAGFVPQSKTYCADKDKDIGEQVAARVLNINPERNNVVLDMKIPENDPRKKYKAGQKHYGTVTNLVTYGAFIELEPDVSGLLHVKQIPGYIKHGSEVYSKGEKVYVKILKVDSEGKISLGLA